MKSDSFIHDLVHEETWTTLFDTKECLSKTAHAAESYKCFDDLVPCIKRSKKTWLHIMTLKLQFQTNKRSKLVQTWKTGNKRSACSPFESSECRSQTLESILWRHRKVSKKEINGLHWRWASGRPLWSGHVRKHVDVRQHEAVLLGARCVFRGSAAVGQLWPAGRRAAGRRSGIGVFGDRSTRREAPWGVRFVSKVGDGSARSCEEKVERFSFLFLKNSMYNL